jgi:putative ABC transport system ATP-binding protein
MASDVLAAHGLTFSYDPSQPLINDWSAEVLPGEVVAITGPSGCGKSTLLYLLGLMLRPQAGSVILGGKVASHLRDAERAHLRAHRFGFVFQDAALDASRSVLDNVLESALYRGQSKNDVVSRAHQLMQRFGVDLRSDARPGQVSGGQAQRVALCRALLGNPLVLLADEPTGNLDPISAEVVVAAFHEQAASGSSVIIVTHDPALVAQCHRKLEL